MSIKVNIHKPHRQFTNDLILSRLREILFVIALTIWSDSSPSLGKHCLIRRANWPEELKFMSILKAPIRMNWLSRSKMEITFTLLSCLPGDKGKKAMRLAGGLCGVYYG